MLRDSPYPCPETDRERVHEARPQGQGQALRIPEGVPSTSGAFVLGFQVLARATPVDRDRPRPDGWSVRRIIPTPGRQGLKSLSTRFRPSGTRSLPSAGPARCRRSQRELLQASASGKSQHGCRTTPHKVVKSLEVLRRLNHGEEATSARLQRFLEITERK